MDYGGIRQCINRYALDEWNEESKNRVFSPKSLEIIDKILDVVNVKKWEDLPGKYIRVETNGWSSTMYKFGNIIEDKWIDLHEFFKEE